MRPTSNTNSPRNFYVPGTRSSGTGLNEEPKPSTVRHDLLAAIPDLEIPPRGTSRTAALYKFIDGDTLSHRDSLELSEWLGEDILQNLDLLVQMQKLEPSFVPMLDLTTGLASQASKLLEQARSSGLKFGVSVSDHLPDIIMPVLGKAMTDANSHVTSIDFSSLSFYANEQTEATRALLRRYISDSKTLECVSGSPSVLTLLEQGVKELRVSSYGCSLEKFSTELLRVLKLGGVEKFSLDRKDRSMDHSSQLVVHQLVVEAVAEANAGLPPQRSVRQVELSTRGLRADGDIRDEDRARIVDRLFSAKHVTAITLPGPNWVPSFSTVQKAHQERRWLQSLQSLTFMPSDGYVSEKLEKPITEQKMDWLPPILQRNKQAALLATSYAGGALSAAVTWNLFENDRTFHLSQHAGIGIEPLARHLGEAFANTSYAQTLTVLNKSAANAAEKGRTEADTQYQENLQVRSSAQPTAEGSTGSHTHPNPREV